MTVRPVGEAIIGELETRIERHSDISRLTTLFRVAEGAWALAVYEDAVIMQWMVEVLRKRLAPLSVIEISLLEQEPKILPLLRGIESPAAIVYFSNVGSILPQLCVQLDLQREALAQLPNRILLCTTFSELKYIAENAPNFYSRISGIFHFPGFSVSLYHSTSDTRRLPIESMTAMFRRRRTITLPAGMSDDVRIQYFERRIRALKQSETVDARAIGESWFALASVYEHAEYSRWPEAKDAFIQAAHQFGCANDQEFQADMLMAAGEAAYRSYLPDQAMMYLDQARTLYQLLCDGSKYVSMVNAEADVLLAMGNVQRFRDEYDAAETYFEQALSLFREISDYLGEANGLRSYGDVQRFRSKYDAAEESYGQALSLFRKMNDHLGEATTLVSLGDVQRFRGEYDAAEQSYGQALRLFKQVGNRLGEANTLTSFGDMQRFQGKYDAAETYFEQALSLFREISDYLGEANGLRSYGDVQQFRSKYDAAEESYGQALSLFRKMNDHLGEATTLVSLGDVQRFRGEYDAAEQSYGQALRLFKQVGNRLGEANTLTSFGDMQRFQGKYDAAETYFEQALSLFRKVGNRLGEANVLCAQSRLVLMSKPEKEANLLLHQGISIYEHLGDIYSVAAQNGNFGLVLLQIDAKERAAHYLIRAATLFKKLGLADKADRHQKIVQIIEQSLSYSLV